MIDVILPALPERELALTAEKKSSDPGDIATRRTGRALTGRVVLGGPVAVPVTAELVAQDTGLAAFLAQEAGTAMYHLLHLSLTCPGGAQDPALHTVNVDLTLVSGERAFRPVAWSMTPQQLTGPAGATARAQLGPQLGFVGHSGAWQRERVSLEALRELRSDPGWQLRHTHTTRIGGTYRLAMVVRAPRTAMSWAGVAVGATVRRGRVLRRYREELPDSLGLAPKS